MPIMIFRLALLAFALPAFSLGASSSGLAQPGGHAIEQMGWLQGVWRDRRDPAQPIDVQWSAQSGNAMVGFWRRTRNGILQQCEMLTMIEEGGEIFYRFDLFARPDAGGDFEMRSSDRLRLLELRENYADFELIGEENWHLRMEVANGVLSGFMFDTERPMPENPRYSYVARQVD